MLVNGIEAGEIESLLSSYRLRGLICRHIAMTNRTTMGCVSSHSRTVLLRGIVGVTEQYPQHLASEMVIQVNI